MKKVFKFIFTLSILMCSMCIFSACEIGEFASFSVSYVSSEYSFDAFSSSIMVEYGKTVNFTKSDFKVYRVNKRGLKQKTKNYNLDASSVNGKRLTIGDYKIYFSNDKGDYKTAMTLTVYEKEIEKPTFTVFETEYDQNEINIKTYLESLPQFDTSAMVVEDSASSVVSAIDAGTYKTKINLKYGYVWNTLSNKTASIEFVWTIRKKVVASPRVSGTSTFTVDYDENYNLKEHTLNFENVANGIYQISGNRQKTAGKYSATVSISNENYCFADDQEILTYDYEILPKTLETVTLKDSGTYEYSGQAIAPNLSNFISKFMTISDISNNVSAGVYQVAVGFKNEFSGSFVFENNKAIQNIDYQISKKQVARPTLKNETFDYTGSAPQIELENYDENLFSLSDTSNNISAGFYTLIVSPKNKTISDNYAFVGSDVMQVLSLVYKIEKAKENVNISFSVPDGQTFSEGMTATAEIVADNISLSSSVVLYKRVDQTYEKVEQIDGAGEYILALNVSFDSANYVLVFNGETVKDSDLQKSFRVL